MSDEIKIPAAVFEAAYDAAIASKDDAAADYKVIARWMREECSIFAETYADDIPDADQDVFREMGEKMRQLGCPCECHKGACPSAPPHCGHGQCFVRAG